MISLRVAAYILFISNSILCIKYKIETVNKNNELKSTHVNVDKKLQGTGNSSSTLASSAYRVKNRKIPISSHTLLPLPLNLGVNGYYKRTL